MASLDPEENLKIGTTLKTLAEEQDVLVVCSGQVCLRVEWLPFVLFIQGAVFSF